MTGALLEESVHDLDKGPNILLDVPPSMVENWARLSPALHDVYSGLGELTGKQMRKTDRGPAVGDLPAAFCLWIIDVHSALFLRMRESGFDVTQCILCMESVADAALSGCSHRYFCAPCLEAWGASRGASRGALSCPVCRKAGTINVLRFSRATRE